MGIAATSQGETVGQLRPVLEVHQLVETIWPSPIFKQLGLLLRSGGSKLWLFALPTILLFLFCLQSPRVLAEATAGELILRQDQFVSSDFEANDRQNFSYIGAKLNNLGISKEQGVGQNGLKAEISGQVSPGDSFMNYVNFSQLFWQENGLGAGRKKQVWSKTDRQWGLGLYEPNFNWNPISPEAQGLTGVFLDLGDEVQLWGITLFASFIYIPDQGPNYEIKGGSFERVNPWFQNPPAYVSFLGQTDKVKYEIEKPQTNEIIFNRSYVGAFHVGKENDGFLFQTALAAKPSNQLALGFKGYLIPNNEAQVQVVPHIYYHNLVSAEFSYGRRNWQLGLGGVTENPESPQFDTELTYVHYRPSSLVSPFFEFKWDHGQVAFSYLKVAGGESEVKGALGTDKNSILPERYPFREASQVSGSIEQPLKRKRALELAGSYLQGSGNEFSVVNFRASFRWDSYWKANLAGQMIAATDSLSGARSLAGQFQNNDSLSLGVSYVF